MTNTLRTLIDGRARHTRNVSQLLTFITVLLTAVAPPLWAAQSQSACDLITKQEVAKVLSAAVSIQEDASGPDPNGGDNCVWTTTDRRNVMVRVVAVPDQNFVIFTFKSEVSNAFSHGKPPEVLTGIADEAKYRADDGTLTGGVLVGRKGSVVFVVEGSTTREHLIALTKILLSHL